MIGILIHLLIRTPKRIAAPAPRTESLPRPEREATARREFPRFTPRRRRGRSVLRTALLLMICGALAGIPFALDAYADVREAVAIEVPEEELEPLPPSYEQAGLAVMAPLDTAEIVSDSNAFRSSNRDLRATKEASKGKYVLPLDKELVTAEQLSSKHHDYPAADLGVPRGTEIYAAHAGIVRTVTQRGKCGRGVVISGNDGYSYIYCHGSEVVVEADQKVRAGETIMFSGNSGHSTGPHLHFGIATADGGKICPQSLLLSWFDGGELSPDEAASDGCFYRSKERRRGKRGKRTRAAEPVASTKPRAHDGDDGDDEEFKPEPRPTPSRPAPRPTPAPRPDPTPTPDPSPLTPEAVTASPTP